MVVVIGIKRATWQSSGVPSTRKIEGTDAGTMYDLTLKLAFKNRFRKVLSAIQFPELYFSSVFLEEDNLYLIYGNVEKEIFS